MDYLIVTKDNKPFYTRYYQYENHYNENILVIFDIFGFQHTYDGINWIDTILDNL